MWRSALYCLSRSQFSKLLGFSLHAPAKLLGFSLHAPAKLLGFYMLPPSCLASRYMLPLNCSGYFIPLPIQFFVCAQPQPHKPNSRNVSHGVLV